MAETIFFKSADHQTRFEEAMRHIGKIYDGKFDPEYASALYILTTDLDIWQQAQKYVSRHGINIEAILKEVDFSGGYSVLIKLAGNLFNGQQHIDPLEFMRLDESNFNLALGAIRLRWYGLRVDALKSE